MDTMVETQDMVEDSVEIVVGGDAEIETLIDSLGFIVKNLKEQLNNKGEWPKNIQ